jgi:hypothetical protein
MDKHHFKLLLGLVFIAIAVALIFMPKIVKGPVPPVPKQIINAAASPSRIPAQTANQVSPDGKNTLTMKKQANGNLINYTFTTNEGILVTRDVETNVIMSIPFNTWSTDDKAVFVKEDTGSVINWYIYPGGINVTDYFTQKLPNFKLIEITGWAADNLLIVNTNKLDGSEGFSYWFDTQSHNFIQLSNRFN